MTGLSLRDMEARQVLMSTSEWGAPVCMLLWGLGFPYIDVGALCNRFIVTEPCRMLSTLNVLDQEGPSNSQGESVEILWWHIVVFSSPWLYHTYIYHPQTKLREGNVFTGICPWGAGASIPQCNGVGVHPSHNAMGHRVHSSHNAMEQGVHRSNNAMRGVHMGVCPGGMCIQGVHPSHNAMGQWAASWGCIQAWIHLGYRWMVNRWSTGGPYASSWNSFLFL